MRGHGGRPHETLKRLRRVEGQICGLQRMVQTDADRIDMLMQIAAATRTLEAVALELLDDHVRRCLAQAAAADEPEVKIAEVSQAIRRLVHS